MAHGTASKPRAQNNTGGFLISWGDGVVVSRRGGASRGDWSGRGDATSIIDEPHRRIFRGVVVGDGNVETGWLSWIGLAFRGQECQSDVIIRII